jgi:hypothetical protein
MGHHWPLFCPAFAMLAALLFAFMAGLYPAWRAQAQQAAAAAAARGAQLDDTCRAAIGQAVAAAAAAGAKAPLRLGTGAAPGNRSGVAAGTPPSGGDVAAAVATAVQLWCATPSPLPLPCSHICSGPCQRHAHSLVARNFALSTCTFGIPSPCFPCSRRTARPLSAARLAPLPPPPSSRMRGRVTWSLWSSGGAAPR